MTEQERWQRIDALFQATLERPEAERKQFLADACGNDDKARQAVLSLLAHDLTDSFLVTPASGEAVRLLAGTGSSLVGEKVGAFEVLDHLGAGGMGEVYLGRDTRLERRVALKRVPAHLNRDPERLRRFRQEALATSALNHPNIVTVHEIVEHPDGDLLVTELIDGVTLRQHRGDRALPVAEAIAIALQIGRALAAAHAVGLVHRDVKPDNVMVRRDGLIKLLDFGIAKSIALESPREPFDISSTGVVGTSAYMSPEQARGEPVDARTDVWSLGVILYELITGQAPFPGATAAERRTAVLEHDPEPVGRIRQDLPPGLGALLERVLTKNPEARPRNGTQLVAALEELNHTIRTPFPSATMRLRSWREHALVGVAIVFVGGLVLLDRGQRGEGGDTAIDSLAVLPLIHESGDPQREFLGDGVGESLIRSLARTPGLRVISRLSVSGYRGENIEPRAVARDLGVRGVLSGRLAESADGERISVSVELVDALDSSQRWAQRYDRPRAALAAIHDEIARDVRLALGRAEGIDQEATAGSRTPNVAAYQDYLLGRFHWYKRSRESYEKSGVHFRRAVEADPDYALAWSGLSHYYSFGAANGMFAPEDAWPRAAETAQRAHALDPRLPDVYNTLAGVKLYRDRDWAGGEMDLETGLGLGGSDELVNHYSFHLGATGRIERAIRLRLELFERDPISLAGNRLYGRTLYHARRFEESAAQFRKTLELHPEDPDTLHYLGMVEAHLGRADAAVAAWSEAWRLSGQSELATLLESTNAAAGFEAATTVVARQRLGDLEARQASGAYVPAFAFVRQHLRAGDREQALVWAQRAFEERNRLVLDLVAEPEFDSLRQDPRFRLGVERLALPVAD